MRTLTLATRGSRLALAQAGLVRDALATLGVDVELLEVTTRGDRDRTSPIRSIGGRGLFVREVEKALLDGSADLAVHSGKDLPYDLADGLVIAGVPNAAPACDLLIARMEDPKTIGTGSPRRALECRTFYPDAQFENIRGNVDTRLEKLRRGDYDAILLAKAGLVRLPSGQDDGATLFDRISSEFLVREFDPEEFVPSACQGLLAVECREEDVEVRELLEQISDPSAWRRFTAERTMFSLLQADCSVPLGVHCDLIEHEAETVYRLTALFHHKKVTREGTDIPALCRAVREELSS